MWSPWPRPAISAWPRGAAMFSQPTLSVQVAQLEQQLGTPLFDRTPGRIVPTAVGTQVVATARSVLLALDDIVAAAAVGARNLGGLIRLGVAPTFGPIFSPHCCRPCTPVIPICGSISARSPGGDRACGDGMGDSIARLGRRRPPAMPSPSAACAGSASFSACPGSIPWRRQGPPCRLRRCAANGC